MEMRRCRALKAQDPKSKHHNSFCAAWEAYQQAYEETRAEAVRREEILAKAKRQREESRGLESNISENDPMTIDNTTPAPEALDTADESPITTHAEFFKENFTFGSRCHNSLQAGGEEGRRRRRRRRMTPSDEAIADDDTTPDLAVEDFNSEIVTQRLADGHQSMHSTVSSTATRVPVQLSPTLLSDKELANAGEGNRPTAQPTLLLPDSFEETEWLIKPANKIAWKKARYAYDQWKQEPPSLSIHTLKMPARASEAVSVQEGNAGSNSALATSTLSDGAETTVEDDADNGGWTTVLSQTQLKEERQERRRNLLPIDSPDQLNSPSQQTRPSRHSVRKMNRLKNTLSTCTKEDDDKSTTETSSYSNPRIRSKPLIPIHCLVPYAPEKPKQKPRRKRVNRNIRYQTTCSSCIYERSQRKPDITLRDFLVSNDDKIKASITSEGGSRSGRAHRSPRQGVITGAPRSS